MITLKRDSAEAAKTHKAIQQQEGTMKDITWDEIDLGKNEIHAMWWMCAILWHRMRQQGLRTQGNVSKYPALRLNWCKHTDVNDMWVAQWMKIRGDSCKRRS